MIQQPLCSQETDVLSRRVRTGPTETLGNFPQARGLPSDLLLRLDEVQYLTLTFSRSFHTVHMYSIYPTWIVNFDFTQVRAEFPNQ